MVWIQITYGVIFGNIKSFNNFLLNVYFDKSTNGYITFFFSFIFHTFKILRQLEINPISSIKC